MKTQMQVIDLIINHEKLNNNQKIEIIKKYLPDLINKEKQQFIDATNQTEFKEIDGLGIHENISAGEQYYDEIFGKN